mmetsp:Transcript_71782/g.142430  ORF Transcript_71782/g.142430 Transcript_71782/m.142430 type:complete len:99 (-) Transcript_71782:65-361(-)
MAQDHSRYNPRLFAEATRAACKGYRETGDCPASKNRAVCLRHGGNPQHAANGVQAAVLFFFHAAAVKTSPTTSTSLNIVALASLLHAQKSKSSNSRNY